MTDLIADCEELLRPVRLWQGKEVVAGDVAVPKEPGIYAWYFRDFPSEIPTNNCITSDGLTLLYVGIAPADPQAKPRCVAGLKRI